MGTRPLTANFILHVEILIGKFCPVYCTIVVEYCLETRSLQKKEPY